MTTHRIVPEARTLRGFFSREVEPVLAIDPGDTVEFATLDAGWGLRQYDAPWQPRTRERFELPDPEMMKGHALCGPVAVRGAEPGMALEVRVNEVVTGGWGFSYAGGFSTPVNDRLGLTEEGSHFLWTLDEASMTARNQHGHTIAMRPFMGVMGVAPAELGTHSTVPPRQTGGNMDLKELTAGAVLYLPVAVPGALFSVGDGHAAQGDGEVGQNGIECPMEKVSLTFDVRADMPLKWPRANTPAGWITLGFDRDLNEAMYIALAEMVDLISGMIGIGRADALNLASLAADMRITQVVNQVWGVHAVLPHETLKTLLGRAE